MDEAPGLLNNVRKIPALAAVVTFLLSGGVSLFAGCVPVATPEAEAPAGAAVTGGVLETLDGLPATVTPIETSGSVKVLRTYDESLEEFPEGIAAGPGGELFVSITPLGQIRVINPDGTEKTLIDLGEGKTLGLAVGADGDVFFAQHSPGSPNHGVHKITGQFTSQVLPGTEEITHPNGLAFDEQGVLYVSDSQGGTLWRIPPEGGAEIWMQDGLLEGTDETPGFPPIGVNGVGWHQDNLYVTNHEKGTVLRIPVLEGGDPGTPEILAQDMYSLDGLTLDGEGNIYAAFGARSQIIMIDPGSGETAVLASRENGLDLPSSLVFGTQPGNRGSLYFTNYAVMGRGPGPGVLVLEPAEALPPDVDEEEYAVYSDLLEDRFARGETKQILIVDHTRVNNPGLVEMDLEYFNEYSPLAPELIESFKERNREQLKLEPKLDLSIKYQLLSQEQIDAFKPEDEASGWKLFYEKYPKTVGYIHLSRVGFNADFTQALVYYEWYHYDQPITGGYSLLNKQDGLWVVESGYEWDT